MLDVGDGVPVWISGPQFDAWKHTQLVIDVVPGRGGGFSLEAPEGMRFLSRGRAFTDDENRQLSTASVITGADHERGSGQPDHAGRSWPRPLTPARFRQGAPRRSTVNGSLRSTVFFQ